MAPLLVHCPKTAQAISTDVDTSFDGLARLWHQTVRLRCPHCGSEHAVKVREAYVQSEISESNFRPLPGLKSL